MNAVFIATSLDGYIADRDGGVGWLDEIAPGDDGDTGYEDFIDNIDAIVMGRNSFETVLGFGIDWPYNRPVYVLSTTLTDVPDDLEGKVTITRGTPAEIIAICASNGHSRLYIDGGKVIQSFLSVGQIDRMTLTRIPVLLGGGVPLFGETKHPIKFAHIETKTLGGGLVQSTYERLAA